MAPGEAPAPRLGPPGTPGRRSGPRRRGAQSCGHRAEKTGPGPARPFYTAPRPSRPSGTTPDAPGGRVTASQDLARSRPAAPARGQGFTHCPGVRCSTPGAWPAPAWTLWRRGGVCRGGHTLPGDTAAGTVPGGREASTEGAGSGPRWKPGLAARPRDHTSAHGLERGMHPSPGAPPGALGPGAVSDLRSLLPCPASKQESDANHRLLSLLFVFPLLNYSVNLPCSAYPSPGFPSMWKSHWSSCHFPTVAS